MSDNPGNRNVFHRLRAVISRYLQAVAPGERAWRGAAWGVLAGVFFLVLLVGFTAASDPAPDPLAWGVIAGFLLLAYLTGALATLAQSLLARIPPVYLLALGAAGALMASFARGLTPLGLAVVSAAFVLPLSLTGASVWVMVRGGLRRSTPFRRTVIWAGLVLGVVSLALVVFLLVDEGSPVPPAVNAAGHAAASLPPIPLPDPASRGEFEVKRLFYGSGEDLRRPEFGPGVDLVTAPVDGSAFLSGWDGPAGWARTRYWGFDEDRLPLNGRVWMPEGEGPFPLVLIVHGNHIMTDFSDPGYAYLGEQLASRGFTFVSVDENFLNRAVTDILSGPEGGLREENDARAWLLLEHLRLWREWNREPGNPFQGKVDLERVALIGHSRGGEAAYVAAAFNRLPYYPDNAAVAFDYGFGIRSVVAIAPVDGQYKPAGISTPLENANYLVLHGTHDGDLRSFQGMRFYDRVAFTGDDFWFKAYVYIDRANHGQFNTRWGRKDLSIPRAWFLNLDPILPAEDQARIAQVFIGAFLEATLHDRDGYRALFKDYRTGDDWLPDTIYLQQYEESTDRFVSTFEEDLDLSTTTMPGGSQGGEQLAAWYEKRVSIKRGTRDTNAAFLSWSRKEGSDERPLYRVRLPESGIDLTGESRLIFSMGDSGAWAVEAAEGAAPEPIDLTLEVVDAAGSTARLPLSHRAYLQPRLKAEPFKAGFFSDTPVSEIVLQTFEFPLADFAAQNPEFNPGNIREVRFIFDRTLSGGVALDNLGFRE